MASSHHLSPLTCPPCPFSVLAGDLASFCTECALLGIWKQEGKTQWEEAWVVTPPSPCTHPWMVPGTPAHLDSLSDSASQRQGSVVQPPTSTPHQAEHGCQVGSQKTRGLTPRELQTEPPRQQLLSEASVE